MAIYFFDKNQTLIKIVPESATFEAIQTQELDDDSLLKDTLSVTVKGDEKLIGAEYMAVKSYKGNAQTFDMYRIVTDTTPDKSMSFTGMSLAPYELNGHIIQDLRPANHSLSYTLNRVLDGTDWRVGYIEDGLSNVTTTFYYVSAKEALKELQSLVGCEFVFKVEISGQKITDKWIEVYSEMGNRTKKRFNYGTNALTVVRETNKADIFTALIGRGKGEEVSSGEDNASGQAGYGRKITFEDIEWKKSSGKPLDKPKGQYYLELPQATQAYGIKNIDGTMKARVGIVDFDDEEDKNRLINLTYQQLLVSSRPKVLFKTTVANIGATGIGDTVTIHRHDLNIHYQTRVRKIVRNKLNDNKTQIELGDAVVTPSTKQAKQNNATIKNLNQEIEKVKANVTTSQTSADGKNTINYGSAEPERKRTGDTWYRPHPSISGETQMLTWNGNAWELVIDTSDLTSVSREVKDAIGKAEEAKELAVSEADNALAQAKADATAKSNAIKEQISGEVNTAISTAESAKALAVSEAERMLAQAKSDATAKANAVKEEVSSEVNTAISTAEDAKVLAVSEAEKALTKAKADATAKDNAIKEQVGKEVNTAIETAEDAKALAVSEAEKALADANKYADEQDALIKQQVTNSVDTAISTAEDAKQTAIDNYNNAVAETERLVGEQTTTFNTKFGEIEDSVDTVNESVSDADAKAEAIKQGLGLSDITLTNQQITDQIRADYDNVKQNANNALTDAGKALTDAYNAQQDADKAIEDFEIFITSDFASVENDIVNAQSTATDALSKAGTAVNDLNTFKIDYNTFITNQFKPALTTATDALSLAEQNEGLFYSTNLIDKVTGKSNVYTKAEIDGTNGYVSKSAFTQNAESVSSELERVEGVALASGSNINLLIRKDEQSGKYLDTGGVIKNTPDYAISTHKINVTSGEKLTFSQNFARNFRYAFYKTDGTFLSFGMSASQKFTITVPTNASYMLPSYSTTENYPKIERGEVKTQWTLAPQDQVNQSTVNYLTSQIEQTAGKITEALTAYTPTNSLDDTVSSYLNNQSTKTAGAIDTKLTSYAKTTDLNGLATETFATNKATETANGVKNELIAVIGTKVDSDTLDGYVSTATYESGVEGISKSISTVEGKIPNFVGGKNLIPKSNEIKLIDYPNNQVETYANGFTKFLTSAIVSEVYNNKTYPIKPNTTYTASATVKTDGMMTNIGWNFYTTEVGSNLVTAKFKKLGTNTYRIFATVTTRAKDANLRFPDITPIGISNATYYEIGEYQLELGSVATDWGLAISDMQTVASLDGNVKSLFTNTSSETSKEIVRKLSAYTPTNSLDSKVATYLTNESSATAGAIEDKLTSYAKSTDLTGLATETYASNVAVSEAGKVEQKLTNYQTTSGLDTSVKTLFTNTNSQTAQYIDNKLSTYISSDTFDSKTQTYLTNNQYQTAGQVATTLNAYTKTDNLDSTVSGYLNNSNSQTAGAINTKLTDYQTTASLDTNVANLFTNTNSATAKKIDSSLTAIKGLIPTTIDNQNMLNGTSDVWLQGDVSNNWNMYAYSGPTTKISALPNSTYIVSADVIKEYNDIGLFIFEYQNNTLIKENYVTGLWRYPTDKVRRSFKIKTGANTNNISVGFRFNASNIQTRFKYRRVQLEHSEIETDWKPSFKDTVSLSDYTIFKNDYKETAESVERRLTAIDSSEEGSLVTRLNATESTASGNSQLITTISNNYVTQKNINESILSDKQIKDTRNDNRLPSWYYTNYPKQTVKEFKYSSVMGVGSDTYGMLTTDVQWVDKSGGTIKQQFATSGVVYNRVSNHEGTAWLPWAKQVDTADKTYQKVTQTSELYERILGSTDEAGVESNISRIVQTSGVIQSEVESADLISLINIQAGGILIQSGTNKLNITPATTFIEDATIKSAMIDSIDVKQIKGVTADFTSMVTKALTANTISSTMIKADDAMFEKLFATSLATDKLASQEAWIKDANIISLDASTITTGSINSALIDAKAIVTGGLTADVVESTHIKSSTGLINKIFANEAYIKQLTSKTAFIEQIKAVEIDAGKITSGTINSALIDAGYIVANGLTTDAIQATHIKAEAGLVDKIFSEEAYIEELTNKSLFTDKIKAIEIDAGKITSGEIDTGRIKSGEVVTAGLTTNVITTDYIKADVGLVDKIFSKDAYIEELTSKDFFAQKIKTFDLQAGQIKTGTLDSALIDAEYIVTNGLTADVIESKYIKAEEGLIDKLFSEKAYIEELTNKTTFTESIKAIEISADKITTGTLDAGKVSVVNLDANNITANITDFIKTNWNEATGGGVTITGSGVRAINSEGSRVTLENGVVSVGNRSGVNLGFFGDHILNKESTGTMTITASLGTETAFISATSADGKTYKRSMSIMSGAGEIDMFTTLDMNKNSLKDVTDIGFTGGLIKGSINGAARYMTIEAGTGTAFDVSGVTRMSITSVMNVFSGIDMKGNDIASVGKLTYNSDQRLKTNIKDTNIRALDAIRNWQLVSYDWLESGEHVEIGLIAQNSPEVMTYSVENDIYGIDAGKQTMINTLAIQQLDSKTNDEITKLKAQIASLQDELALLKGDIK